MREMREMRYVQQEQIGHERFSDSCNFLRDDYGYHESNSRLTIQSLLFCEVRQSKEPAHRLRKGGFEAVSIAWSIDLLVIKKVSTHVAVSELK